MLMGLLKRNISIPEVGYTKFVDVYKDGVLELYILATEQAVQHQWVNEQINNNPAFIAGILKDGLAKAKVISELGDTFMAVDVIKNTDQKLANYLEEYKKAYFEFIAYLDITHIIGLAEAKLTEQQIKDLAYLHEFRKEVFMKFHESIKNFGLSLVKKLNLATEDLNFLSVNELIKLLKQEITVVDVYRQKNERAGNFIVIYQDGKEPLIKTRNFRVEYENLLEQVEKEQTGVLVGKGIGKGKISGQVFKITPITNFANIPEGKIIVATMTSPELTNILKKSKAIVTDEGGVLCHAANIAREFEIIAVIGAKIATKVLKDGDMVEVDANKGIVKII